MIEEVTIEGYQKFENYQKLNPIDIEITDNEILRKLTKNKNVRMKYRLTKNKTVCMKYRFIENSSLFSSSIQNDTKVIFITTTGLNDAHNILVNGKIFKAIGVIYTTEIKGWDKIKNSSNWVNCVLTNLNYPRSAKHLSFVFETPDLQKIELSNLI